MGGEDGIIKKLFDILSLNEIDSGTDMYEYSQIENFSTKLSLFMYNLMM